MKPAAVQLGPYVAFCSTCAAFGNPALYGCMAAKIEFQHFRTLQYATSAGHRGSRSKPSKFNKIN
jgi:hypothetical protein